MRSRRRKKNSPPAAAGTTEIHDPSATPLSLYASSLTDQNTGVKLVEIDARPSDCIALAVAHGRPIFVSSPLFEQVEDMSEVLERINESNRSENE